MTMKKSAATLALLVGMYAQSEAQEPFNKWVQRQINTGLDAVVNAAETAINPHKLNNAFNDLNKTIDARKINQAFVDFNNKYFSSGYSSGHYIGIPSDINENVTNYKMKFPDVNNLVSEKLSNLNPPQAITQDYVMSMIRIESGFNPGVTSDKDARGLMQVTYDAWAMVDDPSKYYSEVYNPDRNIEVGIKYNKYLFEFLTKNVDGFNTFDVKKQQELMAAAYNGGHGRLQDNYWDINRMPSETRKYVGDMDRLQGYE